MYTPDWAHLMKINIHIFRWSYILWYIYFNIFLGTNLFTIENLSNTAVALWDPLSALLFYILCIYVCVPLSIDTVTPHNKNNYKVMQLVGVSGASECVHCWLLSLFFTSFLIWLSSSFSFFFVLFTFLYYICFPFITTFFFNHFHFYVAFANIIPSYQPVVPSSALDPRLNQFQMSWLQSCLAIKPTLAQWSLWSLGGASFTAPSACAYHCLLPGGTVLETQEKGTPLACDFSALS